MSTPRLRILLAKPGLDGHDQGAKIVVRGLIEAGFEVLYTGLRKTPQEIVRAAVDEDVDVIGLSILSGSHLSICRKLRRLMDENGLADRLWVVGGNIPAADRQALKELGVAEVFPTGSRLEAIVDFLRARAPERVG